MTEAITLAAAVQRAITELDKIALMNITLPGQYDAFWQATKACKRIRQDLAETLNGKSA